MDVAKFFPLLLTRDPEALAAFYVEALGGRVIERVPAEGSPEYMAVEVGPSQVGLAVPQPGQDVMPAILWVHVDDLGRAIERTHEAGASAMFAPRQEPWGGTIAAMFDPAGHILLLRELERA